MPEHTPHPSVAATVYLVESERLLAALPLVEYDEPPAFERFFKHKWRTQIMSLALRDILRSVQPFYGLEYLRSVGKANDLGSYADHSPFHGLSTMARVSNIDKHRRLAVTAWWPDIVSWGSDGVTHRRWLPGDGTFVDGSMVGYIVGSDGSDNDVGHEFKLILADPFPPCWQVQPAKLWESPSDVK